MQDLSHDIAPWLPRLRNYAHALLGSQRSGDNRVRVLLELLIDTPEVLAGGQPIQVRLLRLFHSIVDKLSEQREPGDEAGIQPPLKRAVDDLAPRSRQILLLNTVVQLAEDEIAAVLGIDARLVARRLRYARSRIHQRLSARVLVVEAEQGVPSEIGRAVEDLGHQVIGIARTEANAIEMARNGSPELVVVDAKMHDDRALQSLRLSTEAPVILVGPQRPRRRTDRRDSAQRVDSRALERTIKRALPIKAALRESLSDSFRTH